MDGLAPTDRGSQLTAAQVLARLNANATIALTAPVQVPGGFRVGTGSGNAYGLLCGAAGSNRFTRVYTGDDATTAHLRWDIGADGTAESGGNAGSPFLVVAYSDTGAFIDSPISIVRASGGTMALSRPVTMSSTLWIGGGATIAQATPTLTLAATANAGARILWTAGSGTVTNWLAAHNWLNPGDFVLMPSTAAGGLTFTNAALAIGSTGTTSLKTTDTGTSTRPNTLLVGHNTSGTPTSGFGSTLRFQAQTTTLADQDLAMVETMWVTPTHASRASRVAFSAFDSTGGRECLKLEANGSAAAIGFLGAAAVARPTVTGSKGANAALASLLTALANLGLVTDSST